VNVKWGLGAMSVVYLFISAFHMKDGLFIRPHPLLWRVLTGMSIIYLCLMVFLLFQSVDDARWLLRKLDPSLGIPLPERSYAEDCRVFTPDDPISNFRNIRDTFHDEFVPAHLFGWFGKAILTRDLYLCWIMSIVFEVMELSMEHLMPNFAECWWDHIVIDILLCNAIGIYLGLKVAQYFSMKPYFWLGKIRPEIDSYSWDVFSSWKRMLAIVVLMVTVLTIELNAFFLKFILWIPPPHPINIARLVMWWGIGQPGMREYYQWVTDPNCKRFGTMSWMCVAVVGVEVLIIIKMGRGMFPTPTPAPVFWTWVVCIVLFVGWAVWYYGYYSKPSKSSRKHVKSPVPSEAEETKQKPISTFRDSAEKLAEKSKKK